MLLETRGIAFSLECENFEGFFSDANELAVLESEEAFLGSLMTDNDGGVILEGDVIESYYVMKHNILKRLSRAVFVGDEAERVRILGQVFYAFKDMLRELHFEWPHRHMFLSKEQVAARTSRGTTEESLASEVGQ